MGQRLAWYFPSSHFANPSWHPKAKAEWALKGLFQSRSRQKASLILFNKPLLELLIKLSSFELLKELNMCENMWQLKNKLKQLASELNITWTYYMWIYRSISLYETVQRYWQSEYIQVYHFMRMYIRYWQSEYIKLYHFKKIYIRYWQSDAEQMQLPASIAIAISVLI